MATKDNSSGLFSKMARFVRNPTKDWSELDLPGPETEPEHESGYSKLALKELIQRKRQNDFVRRREFDHLRKLHRNEPVTNPDQLGRPSFFQSSSVSNLDERAQTIKKIDEIEAQMSKQWWKSKKEGVPTQQDKLPRAAGLQQGGGENSQLNDSSPESVNAFATTLRSDSIPGPESLPSMTSTQMGSSNSTQDMLTGAARLDAAKGKSRKGSGDSIMSEFSISKLVSVKLGDSLDDPDLEEAAIRFANGDDAGAEATLLNALQADPVNPQAADSWAAALFDLYRATGQQASFDRVAIDYAQRFGHSAPAWFSTPDLLGLGNTTRAAPDLTLAAQSDRPIWVCPAALDLSDVEQLRASLVPTLAVWRLSWGQLESLSAGAAQALAGLFAQWCEQAVTLHFDGAEVLEKVLRSCTPSGHKDVELFWWNLRLDALRIMRLQDEFELAALDFCVTYEVSPPAWADAACAYVQSNANPLPPLDEGDASFSDNSSPTATDSDQATTIPMDLNMRPVVVELAGEVLGDAVEALDQLQAGFSGAKRLVISCAHLIRVDFSAAGSILNWVAIRQSEGCQVQFRDVPRLVAAFFCVIGINEHAQVDLRTN